MLTVGQCATLACMLEVAAPKPGNVHRGADFEDVTFVEFMMSAVAIGPAMDSAEQHGVGATVLGAIRATRALVASNTNLGSVLLIAPLAAVPREESLAEGIQNILQRLTPVDCYDVYSAIRLAQPGGLGRAPSMDVADEPPDDLLAAMRIGAGHDLVARQYVEGFSLVQEIARRLVAAVERRGSLSQGIVETHVRLMSEYPDSLIARKCGDDVAVEASRRAAQVLAAGEPGEDNYYRALSDLDFWLRSDHHRRNPGTTADLIAGGLFIAIRESWLRPPIRS